MNQHDHTNYDHKAIEQKWQTKWAEDGIYAVPDHVPGKENYYTLVEFSYPSGNLHVGHWYAFSVPDIFARYKRMQGYNVLYPMGFDAFGLPAENAAIKLGEDPKTWTYSHMEKMRAQLRSMGAMFDWNREVVSCDPKYYKWTQWMFNEFLKNDLVYRDTTNVNWCPKDQTILANEQVVDGKCERCGTEVVQKNQQQWMLRITKYADKLVDDLDTLEWPHAIKEAQRNWIGRSVGSEIEFKLSKASNDNVQYSIKVFTTRADTLFGVTYVVLAPEHPLVAELKQGIANESAVDAYIDATKKKSELDRQQSKEKTGIALEGIVATNPANGEQVPVWIGDYVLAGYGTGAVMAVPAHDARDYEFATKYGLPQKTVVSISLIDDGDDAPQENVETLDREVVDAIIENDKGEFLLIKETANGVTKIHFVGGGTEGDPVHDAVRKEVMEETGYTDIEIVGRIPLHVTNLGFRHTKLKNQNTYGYFYHVKLTSDNQVASEVEDGKHTLMWVKKSEVAGLINWTHHKLAWDMFLATNHAVTDEGILIDSGEFSGLTSESARTKITEAVGGKLVTTYRLRDWGISRQRYWGVPIPIVYDPEGNAHPIPAEHLPWMLPTDVDHTPDGTAPLARSKELIERTEKIFGAGWRPEVETMDTFVDSSWYFYRYLDNNNDQEFASQEKLNAWMPIDMYLGGAEHTTMHLLYSRFWVKALYDLGLVPANEQGVAEAYTMRRNRGLILGPDGEKMSKSKGNVIDPDEIVNRLGADTVRMYLAFMGPYGTTASFPWDPNGVVGVRRFLERVWTAQNKVTVDVSADASYEVLQKTLHKTIKKVGADIEKLSFNTAISAMMIFMNELDKHSGITAEDWKEFLKVLACFAPHISDELYQITLKDESLISGNVAFKADSIHRMSWPVFNAALVVDSEVTLGVQVNGKVRAEVTIAADASEDTVKDLVLGLEEVQKWIDGKPVKKFIYIPKKIISIVV